MKKTLLLMALALASLTTLRAQDIITLKDGTDIQARILEVTANEVKYKKHSNLDGPTFTTRKADILIIHYTNGEKEVFAPTQSAGQNMLNTVEPIAEGLKYSEYRRLYDAQLYRAQPSDPYSRAWAGVASAFIPGLGQCIDGEWGRGVLIFLGNLGLSLLAHTQYTVDRYGYFTFEPLFWPVAAARFVYDIWSICDAVHVAKVKNMYSQDRRAMRYTQLTYTVSPFVSVTPTPGTGSHPYTGLSLTLSY